MVINVDNLMNLTLGKQGENGVTSFEFDIAPWVEEYGEGAVNLYAIRSGDEEPYPVILDGNTWVVSDIDTAFAGLGEAQLVYSVDGIVKKTAIYGTLVQPSLETSDTPPAPYKTWLDQMVEVADDAKDYRDEAMEYASDAEGYAQAASQYMLSFTDSNGDITIARSDNNG